METLQSSVGQEQLKQKAMQSCVMMKWGQTKSWKDSFGVWILIEIKKDMLGEMPGNYLRNLDSALPEPVQKEFICPVCLNTFTDPVTICCGHSFCRSFLYLFWEAAEIPYQCPVCCEPSQQREYKTNIVLKNLVYIARKANLREFLLSEEQMCGTHKETKMIFCREEESLLCWLCSDSPEHKAHRHYSIEEAIEEQREKLSDEMRSLWEKIQGIQESLNKYGRMTVPSMVGEDGNQGHLTNCMSSLREMYMELVAMCQKPDGELLQELGDTLARMKRNQPNLPPCGQPQLRARPIMGLADRLNSFLVNVTFSRVITNHDTRLFEDARSLRYDRDHLYASLIPGTSDYFASWGEPCFSSGKHYWELEVNDSWDWAVGPSRPPGSLRVRYSWTSCKAKGAQGFSSEALEIPILGDGSSLVPQVPESGRLDALPLGGSSVLCPLASTTCNPALRGSLCEIGTSGAGSKDAKTSL
ncbi:tripartite motif-containing protein 43-like [Leptonychotes weddellii]|uniref:Tripartite motif-containing protein 43-like n=1 Tax=Leptonychotes weddellii TaxID=9713 RepID=A0A2U3X7H7_LEPWE|nr:tripartite motif-containing protein 43-like [Leptonychotes weddellii]